jgi:peptidoglycan DL-endopeptidase CwlO
MLTKESQAVAPLNARPPQKTHTTQPEVELVLRRPQLRRFVAAFAVFFLLTAPMALAAPSTPAIRAKQADAARAQATLDNLRTDAEVKAEEYNSVSAALDKTRGQIEQTRQRLAIEDANLRDAELTLQQRADGIYRSGGLDVIEVVLNTTSFEDFLTRVDLLARFAQSDAQVVTSVKDARQRVAATQRTLQQRESDQIALRDQAEVKRQQAEAAANKQKEFVDSLNAAVAKLIRQEEARLAAEAAARAKALAAAQARAKAAAEAAAAGGHVSVPISDGSGGSAQVVAVAMRYIGVPYVWGGESPSGFDCSGLAQYCYAQIGITIPRVSQDQFYSGKRIPADRLDMLKPGDLMFFGTDKNPDLVHHVVIFAGGDNIIEAPYTGADVRVASLSERLSHGEYVGASRY